MGIDTEFGDVPIPYVGKGVERGIRGGLISIGSNGNGGGAEIGQNEKFENGKEKIRSEEDEEGGEEVEEDGIVERGKDKSTKK